MAQDSLFLRALPAAEVFDRFMALAPEAYPGESVHFQFATNVPGIIHAHDASSDRLSSEAAKQFRTMIGDRPYLVAKTATIHLSNNAGMKVEYSTDDGIVARIRIDGLSKDRSVRVLTAIEKLFNLSSYADLVRAASPVVDQSAIQLRERSVADLQESVRKLADFMSELAIRETEARQKLQTELQGAFKRQQDELEATYRDRHAELEKQRLATEDVFAKRERDFQERVAEIDSRESKYVRRALLKEIKDVIAQAEAATLSKPTGKKRLWLHILCLATLAASGSLVGSFAYKILSSQSLDWHLLAPLAGSVLTFVATMVYYLKWNDRWFREHADAEFAAKRFKVDILRASWIAELVQEWAKEGKGDLPPELIAAYSRNLFTESKGSRLSEHPMDHMTALLKRATEVQVGKTGFSLKSQGRRDGGV